MSLLKGQLILGHVAPAPGASDVVQRNFAEVERTLNEARETLNKLSGRFLGTRVLTGAGTYVPTSGTRAVRFRAAGGGGGGGGAGGGVSVAAGAGGTSGVYIEGHVAPGAAITGGSFTCGAGGAAGANTGGNGGSGGDTIFVIQGVTYTAKGGGGGPGMVNAAGGFALPTLPAAGTSTNVDAMTYTPGTPGINIGGTYWFSGNGGATPIGSGTLGGNDGSGTGTGQDGGLGGGGGSGATRNGAAPGRAGGVGGAGLIIIEEWT